jgi:hypothetical protein
VRQGNGFAGIQDVLRDLAYAQARPSGFSTVRGVAPT